jgi:hypothetical protein
VRWAAVSGPGAVLAAAAAREGLLVIADRNSRVPPVLLRQALARRRPALFVPTPEAEAPDGLTPRHRVRCPRRGPRALRDDE